MSCCIFIHMFRSVMEEQGKPSTSVTYLNKIMSDLIMIKNRWKLFKKQLSWGCILTAKDALSFS